MRDVSIPGWRERVVAAVNAQQTENVKAKRRRPASMTVDYDLPFAVLLKQAAASRGIAVGSYVRRALARQIAKDLGIDWTEVLKHCAAARPHGSVPPGAAPGSFGVHRSFDDGEGFGNWNN
jgi:hypothetical protein